MGLFGEAYVRMEGSSDWVKRGRRSNICIDGDKMDADLWSVPLSRMQLAVPSRSYRPI